MNLKQKLLLLLSLVMLFTLVSCEEQPEFPAFAAFSANGTAIAVDAEAAPILNALGKETAYDESPSCAFEGMDKIYVYVGFRVQTYTTGGKDYIRSVELTDDTYQTPEGISIGSTQQAVLDAYGTPKEQTASAITYLDGEKNVTLQFLLRDGTVTNIQYLTNKG